jgi:hypothetical protein
MVCLNGQKGFNQFSGISSDNIVSVNLNKFAYFVPNPVFSPMGLKINNKLT